MTVPWTTKTKISIMEMTMVGSIALTEVLALGSTDAPSYSRCPACKVVYNDDCESCGCPNGVSWNDAEIVRNVRETLSKKRRDGEYPDLLDSIRLHGISRPILIKNGIVCNGHHRIAAAQDLGISEIPYTDDPEIGWEDDWPDGKIPDSWA